MSKYGWRNGVLTARRLTVNDKIPVQYIIPKTVAYATGAIATGQDWNSASTALTNVTIAAQPPYPINLIVTANVVGTAGGGDSITVVGEDAMGKYLTENIVIKSTAAATTAGAKAFAKIDSISVAGESDANTTIKSTDLGVGYSNIIGLPYPIATSADIMHYAYDGAYATTNYDTNLTISATNNTITMPTNAATKVVSVLYLSKLQE